MQSLSSAEERVANIKEFQGCVNRLAELSEQLNAGDCFSYNRMREILVAFKLGHTIALGFAGEDASDENDDFVEYKSTTQDKINATYNGVSNYPTWDEQWNYICNDKIGCYKWHYCARFEGHKIVEIWKLSGDDVLRCLKDKFYKSWGKRHSRKDPRLGAVLTYKQIKQYGTKVI